MTLTLTRIRGLTLLIVLTAGILLVAVPSVRASAFLSLDFNSELQGWTATEQSQQQTLGFERENAIVYHGKFALNFTSYASPSQSPTVFWLHNATANGGMFPSNAGTKLDFAWDAPPGGATYIGLVVLFTDGRNMTYASGSVVGFANSSLSSLLLLDTGSAGWISHERDVYYDYQAVWGQPATTVGIQALGVVHSYESEVGVESQVSYYDSILLFSPSAEFLLSANPTSSATVIGTAKQYQINIDSVYGFAGTVAINITRTAPNVTSALSETEVDVTPAQNASVTLTLATSPNSPLGSLDFQVTATSGQLANSLNLTLIVTQPSIVAKLNTNKLTYTQGEMVAASGIVNALSGEPITNASVQLETIGPQGNVVDQSNLTSDTAGNVERNFTIPSQAENGTYTIYASISKAGFEDGLASTNFVVGQTNTPSIILSILGVTDLQNNTKNTFGPGETAVVWVSVVNVGASMNQSMLWFTVENPQGVSVMVTQEVGQLSAGESNVRAFSYQIGTTDAPGVYHVTVFETDNYIYLGGSILASAESTFTVTS